MPLLTVSSARGVKDDRVPVIIWLLVVCSMIFGIVVVGGITRLTGSGLSIVEWKPVAGILPPMTEIAWLELFTKYKETPQYLLENSGMSIEGFKDIFFWEYWHRVLGRLIGVAFAVPLLVFLIRRNLEQKLIRRLLVLFCLGGAQGLLGWLMVKSGLVDMPRVSHFRLAAHLSLAFFVLSSIAWVIMEIWPRRFEALTPLSHPRFNFLSRATKVLLSLVVIQIVWGAFTAGLRAGYGFNTFPLMNGFLIPPGMGTLDGFWNDITTNTITVQFVHRFFGWALLLGSFWFWWVARTVSISWGQRISVNVFALLIAGQFLLGVSTLLSMVKISLAVTHQAVGALVAVSVTALVFSFRKKSA